VKVQVSWNKTMSLVNEDAVLSQKTSVFRNLYSLCKSVFIISLDIKMYQENQNQKELKRNLCC